MEAEGAASAFGALRRSVNDILLETGDFLSDLVEAPPASPDINIASPGDSDGGSMGAQLLIDTRLDGLFAEFKGLRNRLSGDRLSVAVLALTKSGKSTLLNAMLGAHVLPTNNVPETARICRLSHTPGVEPEWAELSELGRDGQVVLARGADEIYKALEAVNFDARVSAGSGSPSRRSSSSSSALPSTSSHPQAASTSASTSASSLPVAAEGGSRQGATPLLQVQMSFAALERRRVGGDPEGQVQGEEDEEDDACPDVSIDLLDTPGPNEYGEEQLRHQVERLLDGVDAVLYLLDYTKLKTVEEATVLSRLQSINPKVVQRLGSRLFFVVNKFDQAGTAHGMGEADTRAYVADLVTQQMGMQQQQLGKGVEQGRGQGGQPFKLHPEQVLLVSANEALLSRLVMSGRAGDDTRARFCRAVFGRFKAPADIPEDQYQQAAQQVLQQSGLPALEGGVLRYLYGEAAAIKLLAILDDSERLLKRLSNVCSATAGALQSDVAQLGAATSDLQGQLDSALSQFDEVMQETDIVEGLVTDEIRSRMHHLKQHLFERVSAALEPHPAKDCQPRGRWARVWSLARAALGGGGGSAMGTREEAESRLRELYQEVQSEIRLEVEDFWHSLEASTAAHQRVLFGSLNAHIAQLASVIERCVEGKLEVALQPADITLAAPSADQHHADLEELFARGIHAEVRMETRTQRVQVEDGMSSLCREFGGFLGWRPPPRFRTVQQQYFVQSYCLDPERVTQYFIEMIDRAVEGSLSRVRDFVRLYTREQVDRARSVLRRYGEMYTSAMLQALEATRQGEGQRQRALSRAQAQVSAAEALLRRVAAVQSRLLPQEEDEEGEEGEEESVGEAQEAVAGNSSDGKEEDGREEEQVEEQRTYSLWIPMQRMLPLQPEQLPLAEVAVEATAADAAQDAADGGAATAFLDLRELTLEPQPLLSGSYVGSPAGGSDVGSPTGQRASGSDLDAVAFFSGPTDPLPCAGDSKASDTERLTEMHRQQEEREGRQGEGSEGSTVAGGAQITPGDSLGELLRAWSVDGVSIPEPVQQPLEEGEGGEQLPSEQPCPEAGSDDEEREASIGDDEEREASTRDDEERAELLLQQQAVEAELQAKLLLQRNAVQAELLRQQYGGEQVEGVQEEVQEGPAATSKAPTAEALMTPEMLLMMMDGGENDDDDDEEEEEEEEESGPAVLVLSSHDALSPSAVPSSPCCGAEDNPRSGEAAGSGNGQQPAPSSSAASEDEWQVVEEGGEREGEKEGTSS